MAKNAVASALNIPIPDMKMEEVDLVKIKDHLEGLITDYDPAQLPENALTYALNVEFLRGMLYRRNGLSTYSITKPNSNQVMNLIAFYFPSSGFNLVRADKQKIYRATSAGWNEYTPNPGGIALTGTDRDYFSFATTDNRLFFSNAVDPIRELDSVAEEYIPLGNAPAYRYITAAFDRVIGAGLIDPTIAPTQIGGSGNRNYDEWDPTVDISAFENTLVDSPSAISDDITGLFFNANSLIIPRQRSIWLGTHLDSSTNPFNYFAAIPNIGCDLPRSIRLTRRGLVWLSFQHSCFFAWDFNSEPVEIGQKISRYLKNLIQGAEEIWASYSYDTDKYTAFFSSASNSTVTAITYDFTYKNFVVHEFPLVSTVEDIDFSSTVTTIGELAGTIAGLAGIIDELGGLVSSSTRFFGHSDGELSTYSYYSGIENIGNIVLDDLGAAFTSDIRTKQFELDITDQYINLVSFPFIPYVTGSLNLYYSKDDGTNWTLGKTMTVTSAMLEIGQKLQLKKSIKAERIIWRITSEDVMMSHNGLNVRVIQSGVSKNGSLG